MEHMLKSQGLTQGLPIQNSHENPRLPNVKHLSRSNLTTTPTLLVLGPFDVIFVAVSFQQGVVGDDILSNSMPLHSHDAHLWSPKPWDRTPL